MDQKSVVIIGGGASGFFCAANLDHRLLKITVLEKTGKLLSKVKVSGGGRCNVTNGAHDKVSAFAGHYPRGQKVLKKSLQKFDYRSTVQWFKDRNVRLVMEQDGRMFPESNDSQTIVDCLISEAIKNNTDIQIRSEVDGIRRAASGQYEVRLKTGQIIMADFLCLASGSPGQLSSFQYLENLMLDIVPPVPSLFTFNMPGHSIRQLMGVAAPDVIVKIPGLKYVSQGPVLITHWGLSGPGILKMSAWAARELSEMNWSFMAELNWVGTTNEEEVRRIFSEFILDQPTKSIMKQNPYGLPGRLWHYLLDNIGITENSYGHLGKKHMNKIIHQLMHFPCPVRGKTTFKEEFVTAGGVDTSHVDTATFEHKNYKNLFVLGELLNVDGVTGGYNFQNAWTSAYCAAKCILGRVHDAPDF